MIPSVRRVVVRLALVTVVAGWAYGCSPLSVDLESRRCEGGQCIEGYRCHPALDRCVAAISIGCGAAGDYCPATTKAGDVCLQPDTFLPCKEGYSDCTPGCRTCGADLRWSECTDGSCILGELESCATCTNDCRTEVLHASSYCNTSAPNRVCDYFGSCIGNAADIDGDRSNGCECTPTGNESCDNIDNDCDGTVDGIGLCGFGAVCEDGACTSCTAGDPLHCGTSCDVCNAQETCVGGTCRCASGLCPTSSYCGGDGACHPCTDNDPNGCGQSCVECPTSNPDCVGGMCACDASSCGAGQYCDGLGICRSCADDDPNHCGQECKVCVAPAAACEQGACVCNQISCASGYRCNPLGSCEVCDNTSFCGPNCNPCPPFNPVCTAATGSCACSRGTCAAGQYCLAGSCTLCSCSGRFGVCVDLGNDFTCRCSAASCGAGTCTNNNATCEYFDDFATGAGAWLCPGTMTWGTNTWARGTPTWTTCHSGNDCWGTSLSGDYTNCELSCFISATSDTTNATEIEVRFWTKYNLESDYDGVTMQFLANNGWVIFAPEGGWDVGTVLLGDDCSWTDVNWPAYGQYTTTATIGWEEKRFVMRRSAVPELFHSTFRWRIYLESDNSVVDVGFYVDDVTIAISYEP